MGDDEWAAWVACQEEFEEPGCEIDPGDWIPATGSRRLDPGG
jgi:hypothetical protein